MVKNFIFLPFFFLIMPNLAMVRFNPDQVTMETENMRPWVQKAKSIKIKGDGENYIVLIKDNSTILDIKKRIHHVKGFSIAQQIMYPIVKNKYFFWCTKLGPKIKNNRKRIKEIMHQYNTDRFALSIVENKNNLCKEKITDKIMENDACK